MKFKDIKHILLRKHINKDVNLKHRENTRPKNTGIVETENGKLFFLDSTEIDVLIRKSSSKTIFKGVMIQGGETQIVTSITGKKTIFPAMICDIDSSKKIKEAHSILRKRVAQN
ncbi:MAG: hypothetical protein ACK43K_06125 [Chitinophagales bacterium]|jgi:hypothetical protein